MAVIRRYAVPNSEIPAGIAMQNSAVGEHTAGVTLTDDAPARAGSPDRRARFHGVG